MKAIDLTQSPAQIDLELEAPVGAMSYSRPKGSDKWIPVLPEGEANPYEMLGIYKIEQNQMTYCWAAPGNPRPTDFSTPTGSNQTLIRLERFSHGEQEIEEALRLAEVYYYQDEDIGWIESVSVTDKSTLSADAIAKVVLPLKKLHSLSMKSGELTDEGLRNIAKLTSLKNVQVKSTSITTEGFAHLRDMEHLTWLSIESDRFDDASIEHALAIKQLNGLDLNGTTVTEAGLKKLLQIESLSHIGFNQTEISDEGLATLAQFPNLHYVSLMGTKFNNKALAEFALTAPKLRQLNIPHSVLDSAALLKSLRKNPDLAIFINHNLLRR